MFLKFQYILNYILLKLYLPTNINVLNLTKMYFTCRFYKNVVKELLVLVLKCILKICTYNIGLICFQKSIKTLSDINVYVHSNM